MMAGTCWDMVAKPNAICHILLNNKIIVLWTAFRLLALFSVESSEDSLIPISVGWIGIHLAGYDITRIINCDRHKGFIKK